MGIRYEKNWKLAEQKNREKKLIEKLGSLISFCSIGYFCNHTKSGFCAPNKFC